VDQEREPAFEDNWRVFDAVIAYTRDLVGPNGTEDLGYIHGGRIGVFDVEPVNPPGATHQRDRRAVLRRDGR
jgi:hypothetical protein